MPNIPRLSQIVLTTTAICWLVDGSVQADETIKLSTPVPYQVIQRTGVVPGAGYADVVIRGETPKGAAKGDWEYRIVMLLADAKNEGKWSKLSPKADEKMFQAKARVDAGGWYRLEVRCRAAEATIASGSVEPIGVGEVFVVAGQSYATNCNDELFKVTDPQSRVASFDVLKGTWRVAHDPQPVVDDSDGGSIWPPLGDALAKELRVPIGFANVAFGGTSSVQWQPDGKLYPRLAEVGKVIGRFRAVLWQQGESDVIAKTSLEQYVANIATIHDASAKAWGFEAPWLLAKSTHHPTVYNNPELEGRIRSAIDVLVKRPGFKAGPDTDMLKGENRGDAKSRRHFSAIGQRRAAEMWRESIRRQLLTDTADKRSPKSR